MMARVDLNTYTPLPWYPGMVRFVGDLYVEGKPYPYCPRLNLQPLLKEASDKFGFFLNVGLEPEHFLVTRKPDGSIEPWDPGDVDQLAKPCYDFKGISSALGYLQEIVSYCNQLGWGAYQADHEDANGQYEVNFQYADALATADRYTFFKMMTSQVAPKYGAVATHMAKPFADRTGSGAHMHYHVLPKSLDPPSESAPSARYLAGFSLRPMRPFSESDRFLFGSWILRMVVIFMGSLFLEFRGLNWADCPSTWMKLIPIFLCGNPIPAMNRISASFWKNIFPMPMALSDRCKQHFLSTRPTAISSSENCPMLPEHGSLQD